MILIKHEEAQVSVHPKGIEVRTLSTYFWTNNHSLRPCWGEKHLNTSTLEALSYKCKISQNLVGQEPESEATESMGLPKSDGASLQKDQVRFIFLISNCIWMIPMHCAAVIWLEDWLIAWSHLIMTTLFLLTQFLLIALGFSAVQAPRVCVAKTYPITCS